MTIGPELLDGLLFPAVVFGAMSLVPWLDRTIGPALGRYEYHQPPTEASVRLSLGVRALSYISIAAVRVVLRPGGLSLSQIWMLTLGVPGLIGAAIFGLLRRNRAHARLDPISQS